MSKKSAAAAVTWSASAAMVVVAILPNWTAAQFAIRPPTAGQMQNILLLLIQRQSCTSKATNAASAVFDRL